MSTKSVPGNAPFSEKKRSIRVEHFSFIARLIGMTSSTLIPDAETENEEFSYDCALSDDNIEAFLEQCGRIGFLEWRDKYIEPDICDGHQWGITILFKDGSTKEIVGSNAYPDTWNDMAEAFWELTGENILLVRND
ncbi:MAG: hypothetical protein JW780_03135 [Clostridiales bacterium]|nr:hypothetical protein [Clostridiales bacterium]